MKNIYGELRFPLEQLCLQCHHIGARGFPNFDPVQCIDLKGRVIGISFRASEECRMLDVIMLAIGLGFFALSVGYTVACDRL
jgi:hypothetical protein